MVWISREDRGEKCQDRNQRAERLFDWRQKHIPASLARVDDPFAMDGTVLSKYGRVTLVRQLGISRREGASRRVGNRGWMVCTSSIVVSQIELIFDFFDILYV